MCITRIIIVIIIIIIIINITMRSKPRVTMVIKIIVSNC